MDDERIERIEFRMEGSAFDVGLPLHIITPGLESLQSILERSYLALSDRRRMAKADRAAFEIRSYEIRRGSFVADLGVVLTAAQLALPVFQEFGPKELWNHTKLAFDLLKRVFDAARARQRPHYELKNNGDVTLHIGDVHNHYHAPVHQIALDSLSAYRKMAHLVRPADVQQIQLTRGRDVGFRISAEQFNLFDVPVHIEQEVIEVSCEIYSFNKDSNSGRLRIKPGQLVTEGNYRFSVSGKQDAEDFIESMLQKKVKLAIVREVRADPFSGESIARLRVVGIGRAA